MKHTKHTPGHWTVDRDPYGRAFFIQQPDTKANGGWVVATAWGEDKEANARLIAAAPELLAALAKVESDLTALLCERVLDSTLPEFYTVRDARNAARAAIAKATGQA